MADYSEDYSEESSEEEYGELYEASERGDLEGAKRVLDMTPLIAAARNGHEHVVAFLLDSGADIKATDEDGITALHWAAEQGHLGVVVLLLAHGAEIDAVDEGGTTPLMGASAHGKTDVVEHLIRAGASVGYHNSFGVNALFVAARNGRVECTVFLLNAGAAEHATELHRQVALELLEEHAGDSPAAAEALRRLQRGKHGPLVPVPPLQELCLRTVLRQRVAWHESDSVTPTARRMLVRYCHPHLTGLAAQAVEQAAELAHLQRRVAQLEKELETEKDEHALSRQHAAALSEEVARLRSTAGEDTDVEEGAEGAAKRPRRGAGVP